MPQYRIGDHVQVSATSLTRSPESGLGPRTEASALPAWLPAVVEDILHPLAEAEPEQYQVRITEGDLVGHVGTVAGSAIRPHA
jgi:hypothetical protein